MTVKAKPIDTSGTEEFEKAAATKYKRYILKLYITGMTPRSQKAIANIKRICEEYLKDNYELEVIDIYQQPALAQSEQIVAVPTLIKKLPLPMRRLIGDISQEEKIIVSLDLRPKPKKPAPKIKES